MWRWPWVMNIASAVDIHFSIACAVFLLQGGQ